MKAQRQAKRNRQKFNANIKGRSEARWDIIRAANMHKMKNRFTLGYHHPILFGMNNLQQAVFIVRQHNLVKPKVLVTAGFRVQRSG